MIDRRFWVMGVVTVACWTGVGAEELRPARPPKDPLLHGDGRGARQINEGRRIILDEDSYPRAAGRIVAGPTVARTDRGLAIRFALDKPDDVLLRIVDREGKTVRNLACGVLGWNAPEPLKPDSLEQEVFWDGKDAAGAAAPAGCKVRLAVGLTPRFDRFVAHDPEQILPGVCGLEVDDKGRLYVAFGSTKTGDRHVARYDREGKYLETVYPPNPHNLTDKLENVHRKVDYVDGRAVPKKRGFWPYFLGQLKWGEGFETKNDADPTHHRFPMRIAGDGRAYVLDPIGYRVWYDPPQAAKLGVTRVGEGAGTSKMRLMQVQLDPFWFLDYFRTAGHWAIGADGFVYAVMDNTARQAKIWKIAMNPLKAISDFEHNGPDKLSAKRYFIGGKLNADGKWLLQQVIDLAVDEDGNLYVADGRSSGQSWDIQASPLTVFRPDGRLAASLDRIELDGRKSPLGDVFGVRVARDALYVAARLDPVQPKAAPKSWRSGQVVKFARSPGAALKAVWAAPVAGTVHLVAVDERANPPIVWAGNGNGPATFTRIPDLGDRSGELRHCAGGIRPGVLVDPWAIALDGQGGLYAYDRAREAIVCTSDDGSQWIESAAIGAAQFSFHMDRRRQALYVARSGRAGGLIRYSSDLKTATVVARRFVPASGATLGATDAAGNVYVGDQDTPGLVTSVKGRDFLGVVRKYSLQGELVKKDYCITYATPGSLAMDSAGCIYATDVPIGDVKAPGHNMPTEPWSRAGKSLDQQSEFTYLVKFPPGGGARCTDSELWAHRGVSIVNAGMCACTIASNTLAIDQADRIFAADFLRYHVKVLDTAGNLIGRVGAWGSADCRGPASKYPEPEIAFGWLYSIDACGDTLYASDRDLARVVKVRMDYRELEEAAVP